MRWFVTLLLFISFHACKDLKNTSQNPHNLKLINAPDDYLAQVESDPRNLMVDIEEEIPGIIMDIRYATRNNFTGETIYTAPKAYLRKPAVAALKRVQDSLKQYNLGLIVYDAYRPYAASLKFFEVYPDTNFVANPKYGSRHNRGCAVDVTLACLVTKEEIPMPTAFDEFTERAHPNYPTLHDTVIKNRTLLTGIMAHFGFTQYPTEWWHFDFTGWENFELMDLTFEELESLQPYTHTTIKNN